MVERADQGEVLELRSTAVAPPPDVVRLGESSHPTAREATLAIAITDLAEHPRGRLSPGAPQPRSRCPDGLPARSAFWRAECSTHRGRMEHRTVLDLAATAALFPALGLCVDHHRCPVRVAIDRDARRAHRDERVGPPRVRAARAILVRHGRDGSGHALERSGHNGAFGGRQLGLQCEAASLVEVPPAHRPRASGPDHIIHRGLLFEVAPAADRLTRDAPSPHDQPLFGSRRREPRNLDHLVDAERAARESLREPGQVFQRERRRRSNGATSSPRARSGSRGGARDRARPARATPPSPRGRRSRTRARGAPPPHSREPHPRHR